MSRRLGASTSWPLRRLLVCCICLLAASSAVGCGARTARAHVGGRPVLTGAHLCPGAQRFTCAGLTVPLDYAGQASGRLRLAVAVERGPAPRGVLLFLTGGPGQPGVPYVERVLVKLHAALSGFRLVMFDQRGTGAGALRCPALQVADGAWDLLAAPPGAVESCARSIGPARRFFTTPETLGDMDRLRRALGVSRLSLDGVSYGTFVAERYALRYPTHVERLVLDSVVPQQGVDPLYRDAYRATARVLRSVCVELSCGLDPAADLATVVRRRRDGPALLAALVAESVISPRFAGVLADLHRAAGGDEAPLRGFIAAVNSAGGVPAAAPSQGLHESTLCLDLAAPWDPAAPASARGAALARLAAGVGPAELYPFDRRSAEDNGLVQNCLRWPPTAPPALPEPAPGTPLPPVPVLLLAGARDLSTPLAWAEQELPLASRGHLVVVPGAGHSVQLRARDPAVRKLLRRFINSTS